ncbi:type III-A CRISPR-associated protein Csm2 [Thermus sp.]|uniref:type III-A CRISPR-associated protein Csm2 n=1 Tax=Thermus sp. TaxID=275 RepID=UPI003D0A069B
MAKTAFEEALILVKDTSLTSSQFRNYFAELRLIQRDWEERGKNWEDIQLALELLIARLAYGRRKSGGVPERFFQLLVPQLRKAQASRESFTEVSNFIEAILAFFYPLKELKDEIDKENREIDKENRKLPRDSWKPRRNFEKEAREKFGRWLEGV